MVNTHSRKRSFVHQHSLSIVSAGILILWICLYSAPAPAPILVHSLATQLPTGPAS